MEGSTSPQIVMISPENAGHRRPGEEHLFGLLNLENDVVLTPALPHRVLGALSPSLPPRGVLGDYGAPKKCRLLASSVDESSITAKKPPTATMSSSLCTESVDIKAFPSDIGICDCSKVVIEPHDDPIKLSVVFGSAAHREIQGAHLRCLGGGGLAKFPEWW